MAHASRSMTTADKNYARIEKEQLGVVFACERFHIYIYGLKVIVVTDHQPLIAISKKQLCDAPPRLQRLLLHIHKYDLMLEYTPGKLLVVADTLSISISPKEVASTTDNQVHSRETPRGRGHVVEIDLTEGGGEHDRQPNTHTRLRGQIKLTFV